MDQVRPRSVLHVVEGLDDRLGGLQAAVMLMANAQARAGNRVVVASGRDAALTYDNLAGFDPQVEVRLFPYGRWSRRFSGSPRLTGWLLSAVRSVDVVHVHAVWAAPPWSAAVLALLNRRALLMSPHGSLDKYDVQKHGAVKRLVGRVVVRPVLSRARAVVCTTEREASDLVGFGSRPTTRVIAIPPGRLPAPSRSREEVRAGLGVGADESMLLFLGRLDHKKGVHHLIDALALAPDLHARLVIAGGGDQQYEQSVRELALQRRVEHRITWAGWLGTQDKADAYHAADLFVLLSYNENYGITVVEAAQAGLPILLTDDVYTSPELLRHGVARATTRDPAVASVAITHLLGDPGALAEMRSAAHRFTAEHLADARIQRAYSELLDEAPDGPPASSRS